MAFQNEFIYKEKRKYRFKLGTPIASSLSGFIAGAFVASSARPLFVISGKM